MRHVLTNDFRRKQKGNTRAMFPVLHAGERDGWLHLVTGDESWFFFNMSLHGVWILSRDDMVIKPRQNIQGKIHVYDHVKSERFLCY
jgi:hypothetical protein